MDLNALLGPAVVAAIIAAIANSAQNRRSQNRLRLEKVSDFHTALSAEIAVNARRYFLVDLDQHRGEMLARMRADPGFVPMVPKHATSNVYAQIVKEIHVIEGKAVELVVDYYFRESQIDALVEDLRSATFRKLDVERRCAAYSNYIDLIQNALAAGLHARYALRAHHPGRRLALEMRLRARWLRGRALVLVGWSEKVLPAGWISRWRAAIWRMFRKRGDRRYLGNGG